MKKLRNSTVEPVLGTLVIFLAMRLVNTRGIEQANKPAFAGRQVHAHGGHCLQFKKNIKIYKYKPIHK